METFKIERVLNSNADDVFNIWADFGSIYKIHPVVVKSPLVGEIKKGLGTKRVCHFKDGNQVVEEITDFSAEKREMTVDITDAGKMPLKSGRIEIKITQVNAHSSKVTFEMQFKVKMGFLGTIMAKLMIKPMMKKILNSLLDEVDPHIRQKIKEVPADPALA